MAVRKHRSDSVPVTETSETRDLNLTAFARALARIELLEVSTDDATPRKSTALRSALLS